MSVYASIRGRVIHQEASGGRGWLPGGAVLPRSGAPRDMLLDLEIVDDGGGHFLLQYRSPDSGLSGETWHETLEEAFDRAEEAFGIARDEWRYR